MKTAIAAALIALAGTGCATSGDATSTEAYSAIVGSWTSAGIDVAPGMAATHRAARIDATFTPDQTYTITVTDSAGATSTSSGTWVATGTPGTLNTFQLNQISPTSQLWEGVAQVNGAHLTYEVAQIAPAVAGVTAPTVAGGFGSTMQDGAPRGSAWIQRFVVSGIGDAPPCTADGSPAAGKRPCDPSSWARDGKQSERVGTFPAR
jgi:hypothetical protein